MRKSAKEIKHKTRRLNRILLQTVELSDMQHTCQLETIFSKIQLPNHCLHSVLPEEKTSSLALRSRGHQLHMCL